MNLAMDRKIVMQLKDDITQIYANTFYYMEANTAAMLKQLDVTYDVAGYRDRGCNQEI